MYLLMIRSHFKTHGTNIIKVIVIPLLCVEWNHPLLRIQRVRAGHLAEVPSPEVASIEQ